MATAIGVSSSLIGGDGRPILEPGALFVDGNYAWRLNVWCSVAGVTIALRSRFLRSNDGQLVDSDDDLVVTSDRLLTTKTTQLAAGFPLNAQVFALTGTPLVGQCFVQLQIIRGAGPAAIPMATVLQGYVTATQALSWPGSPITSSVDGPGAPLVVIVGIAPLGTEVSTIVPVNARFAVGLAAATFVAGAAVANRNPTLVYLSGGALLMRSGYNVNVTAGQTRDFSWMTGFGNLIENPLGQVSLSLPTENVLLAGVQITTLTSGLQAGDQWRGLQLAVRQWIDV